MNSFCKMVFESTRYLFYPHDDLAVINLTIANYEISKVMVDTGAL